MQSWVSRGMEAFGQGFKLFFSTAVFFFQHRMIRKRRIAQVDSNKYRNNRQGIYIAVAGARFF